MPRELARRTLNLVRRERRGVLAAAVALVWACSSNDPPSASPTPGGLSAPDASAADAGADGAAAGPDGRPYTAFVPSKYDPKVPTPLVLQLHGYTWDSKRIDAWLKMSALGEERTFLVATPDGKVDLVGNRFWEATDTCCNYSGSPVDDSGYLADVIADMKARYNVDPKRVYVVGHSNGGFMAHRLGCDHADVLAAIVSFAGSTYADPSKCKPTAPVAVLQIHGTADEMVKYGGGALFPLAPSFPGAAQTVAMWAGKNGCGATLEDTGQRLDIAADIAGDETTISRHDCTQGAAELWTIEGAPHEPVLQPSFAGLVYDFLTAHPKP
jgi:polyhydroxybutyrate depolymerase